MKKASPKPDRFDQLLQAMVTQPVPSERLVKEARTSKQADAASYGDNRRYQKRERNISEEIRATNSGSFVQPGS
jgi:hypothetical protein